jgi:Nif-specific regulatory protein
MNAHLTVVSGPLTGASFKLDEVQFSIGRSAENDAVLEDSSTSRKHCLIEQIDGQYRVRDLGSHNQTYVNDVVVTERWLEPRDRIRVGRSVFCFVLGDEQSAGFHDHELNSGATVILRPEDAVYLNANRAINEVGRDARAASDLECLLEAAKVLCAESRLEQLASGLLQLVIKSIPAQAASILLTKAGEPFKRFDAAPAMKGEPLPKGIVHQVASERVSIWTNDVQSGGEFDVTASIISSRLSAVLAVPLISYDKVLGVIVATRRDSSSRFDDRDLQLLTGIAGFAAGSLNGALELEWLQEENQRLQTALSGGSKLIGDSPAMQTVRSLVSKAAPTSSTVLITGESGTGKELVARGIHAGSKRSSKPFLAINCAALTETLLESELFGHEKGAFTGAVAARKGKLEEANEGTVFLDEVGEMAAGLQAKLLRVLQERELERVGGNKTIKVDIRLIAATNRDLPAMVRTGTFRQDLYYRLNVITIHTPPLRDRRSDISTLALYFIQKHAPQIGRQIRGISRDALECLLRYDWPGNVRELENAIERALVLGCAEDIQREDLPDALIESAPRVESTNDFHELVNEAKRKIILTAVEANGGSYSDAARQLGIHPNNLHRLIRNLEIRNVAKKF